MDNPKTELERLIQKYDDNGYVIKRCGYDDDFFSFKHGIDIVLEELKYILRSK